MSERTEQFQVAGPPRLEVRIGSGDVTLVGGDEGVVEVTLRGRDVDDVIVEQRGDTIVVDHIGGRRLTSKITLTARVPPSAEVEMKLGSADLSADVALRELRVATGSGDIRVSDVSGSASVATGAGDVTMGAVGGRLQASLASGDLSVDAVDGDLDVRSAAGDLRAGRAGSRVTARTAAGDVDVARFDGEELVAQSMSGDVRIGIPAGRILEVDIQTLSGSVRNEFGMSATGVPDGPTATLKVKTLSGDVVLRPAR